ncbi:MAG TPA: hypothetical protein DCZ94_03385 [Lentisphaeria bacterium]|nr:MAG: hypothetical protein A2X48_04045 [Lentisphaerae bacterium GWF2_49_21]HBC85977.1 hypothetical protein [Lentisphaeria bacterium]
MKKTFRILSIFLAAILSPCFLSADDAPVPDASTPALVQKKFSSAQLEQLVAPIALYPDGLLAQVLAAASYPVDVVEAARWIKHNPELSQNDIKNELQNKKWDPSVKGLVFFPQLLAKLNDNLDWTKDLGDAFVAQQKDVMDAVQSMRAKAQAAGTLKSDSKQKVDTQDGAIQIQSADPDTVYVQNYVPSTSYGAWNGGGSWYYPDVVVAPAWPWGWYGGSWAIGFYCAWGHGWIAYNNNFWNNQHWINPWKYNSHNLYSPNPNGQWRHDQANTRPLTQNTQQIAKQLESEKMNFQNFKGGNNAAAKELRQAVDGHKTGANALQSAEREMNANRALQNTERGELDHGLSGTRNGDLERTYSDRGFESRSLSSSYHGSGGYHGGGGFHGGGRR